MTSGGQTPMNVDGARVIVTGAGHGIGRAIAARLAADGARVLVADVDASAATAVAAEIGGIAHAVDLSLPDGPATLVDTALQQLGTIDLYVSNAGIDAGAGLEDDDAVWTRALDINLLAHVRGARALIPHWRQIGGGRLIITASAAGLLSMVGNAPYSVTKHGAVALAEWLAIEYGDAGITVQALCPQGVQTRMLRDAGPLQALLSRDGALTPEQIADTVRRALDSEEFLILPHPEVADYYIARATHTDKWLAGMRRLRRDTLTAGDA